MATTTPRLLRKDPPIDGLISYMTDLQPVLAAHRAFLAAHHRDGDAFADVIVGAGAALLAKAARLDGERAQAVAATEVQGQAIAAGAATVRKVREFGRFVADELEATGADPAEVARLRTACGVGVRGQLHRQSGVRRMLIHQQAGLAEIGEVLATWRPPFDLGAAVDAAIETLDHAIREQSREDLEADLALDDVAAVAAETVSYTNRALRLVGTYSEVATRELLAALRSLEGNHTGVFNTRARTSAEGEPEPPDDDLDPTDDLD